MRSVRDYGPCGTAKDWLKQFKTEEEAWAALTDPEWISFVLWNRFGDENEESILARLTKYPILNSHPDQCNGQCLTCMVDKIGHEAVKQEFSYKELASCSET